MTLRDETSIVRCCGTSCGRGHGWFPKQKELLVWKWIADTSNSYEVIRKLRMHFWEDVLRHVTVSAISNFFRTDQWPAGGPAANNSAPALRSEVVTTQTFLVIETSIFDQRFVGIVTSRTGKLFAQCLLPTAALLQPVWLKANATETYRASVEKDIHRAPMT